MVFGDATVEVTYKTLLAACGSEEVKDLLAEMLGKHTGPTMAHGFRGFRQWTPSIFRLMGSTN